MVQLGFSVSLFDQRDGVGGDGFTAAGRIDAFVGLAFDADVVDGQCRARRRRFSRIARCTAAIFGRSAMTTTSTLTTAIALSRTMAVARAQQIDARCASILRVGVGKVPTDVTGARRAQHGVGHRVAHGVGVGVAEQTALGRES